MNTRDLLYRFYLRPDDGGGSGGGDDGSGDGDTGDGAGAGGDQRDEKVTLTKAEHDALRREVSENRRAAKKAKADADRAAADKAKADGDLEKVAKDAEARADAAEQKLASRERNDLVKGVAERMKFRSPERAHRFLDDSEMEDEPSVEKALKALKREEPDLFRSGGRSGGDIDQDTDAGKSGSMDSLIRRTAGRA